MLKALTRLGAVNEAFPGPTVNLKELCKELWVLTFRSVKPQLVTQNLVALTTTREDSQKLGPPVTNGPVCSNNSSVSTSTGSSHGSVSTPPLFQRIKFIP